MSKSLGRVFGIAKEGPYGYETDYMQYLSGYNPYNYEQTLKNMIANAANMNPRPPYQIQENQNTMPAYLEPTKAYSPSNSPSDMLYKDWLITNDFLNRLKQNAADSEDYANYNLNTTMQGSDYSPKLPEFDDSLNYTTESVFGYPNDTSSPYYQQIGRPYNMSQNSNLTDRVGKYLIGSLSQEFESNDNPAAIGFDNKGGHSYGLYQIATRPGTMQEYLQFLANSPNQLYQNYATVLNNAGGNNGAMNRTPDFENAWIQLAKNPEFSSSQSEFIGKNRYNKIVGRIQDIKGLNLQSRHPVVSDAIRSMAVQHGQAQIPIHNALGINSDISTWSDEDIINALYDARSCYMANIRYTNPDDIKKQQNILNHRYPKERKRAIKFLKNRY